MCLSHSASRQQSQDQDPSSGQLSGTDILDHCAHAFLSALLAQVFLASSSPISSRESARKLTTFPGQKRPISRFFHAHYLRDMIGWTLYRRGADVQRFEMISPRSCQGSGVEPGLDPRTVSICLLVDCGSLKGTDLGTAWALS